MPLVLDQSQAAPEGDVGALPAPQPQGPAPSALDVAAAAERQSNVAGMLYDRFYANPKPSVAPVPGFDPLASVPNGYSAYADRFLDAQSPQEVQWIKGRIDQEISDRQTIARAGGWGVAATLAAGATDPVTIASMAIPVAGEARLANMGRLAVVAGGAAAAQEGIAQAVQETRTPGESLTNIASSAILGGILGAAIRPRVPQADFDRLASGLDEIPPKVAPIANPTGASTAGAAAAQPGVDLAGNTITGPAKTLAEGPIGQVAPGLRLLTSPSNEVRDLAQHLVETPEMLAKNLEGIPTPTAIETKLRGYDGLWYQGWKARGDAFRDYRERIAGSDTDEAPLSRGDFNEQVAFAMRRGDNSAIPEVAQAATDTRHIVFDPLKERAIQLGLLPDQVKATGADSYLMRQYNAAAIRANMPDWLDRLTQGVTEQGVDPAEARDIAYKATRNVLGSERGTMDWNVLQDIVPKAGPLEKRTLELPDTLLEPYLNNDIDHLSHSYIRSMAPEVEMTARFGSRDLHDQFDAVKDDYARLQEQAIAQGKPEQVPELDARRDADLKDLAAVRDRLYGIYGQPKDPSSFFIRAGRLLRTGNALRLLGAATLAHFPDIANVITRFGLPNTFRALTRLGTSLQAVKLTTSEARRMGIGLDMVTNTTAALLGDYGSHSQFFEQRLASRLARGFSIATGETPLITTVQSVASLLSQDELLRAAEVYKPGALAGSRQLARFASAGIDPFMLDRIGGQYREFGREVNGLKFGMSDTWRDRGAAQAFEGAVSKDAHGMTLRPSAGDLPLLMSSELGKALLQFKSFAFAASRHVLMPLSQGIAAGDVRAATGLLALLGSGYLSYWAKQRSAGMPVETHNMTALAGEVLDRSNLPGWIGQAIWPAIWQLGFKDLSRWSDQDAVETIGGPVAGTVADVYERRLPSRIFGNQVDPQDTFRRSDLHFIRRLLPGQNLWYFRRGVNNLEDSIGDLFNLPGESQKEIGEARDAQAQ
jgi:hypothetical protein